MSYIKQADREQILAWGAQAESLYRDGNIGALKQWLSKLETDESTHASIVEFNATRIAGPNLEEDSYTGFNLGRSVEWKIHLYFNYNPVMEVPFASSNASFLIRLPARMRPGAYLPSTRIVLQVLIPLVILALVSLLIYRHIMQPLRQLEMVAREFSSGNLDARVHHAIGTRNDELSHLTKTFDEMADRIGAQIIGQRQVIANLSHELRTSLTRLDIAVTGLENDEQRQDSMARISRESQRIRKLVEDSLTLAWIENEQPRLQQEDIDLVDLIDVIVEDAQFEFPDRAIEANLPDSAVLKRSNHRSVGEALENFVRNAMRFTPRGESVEIDLRSTPNGYQVEVRDKGPGVPDEYLERIFEPFFKIDHVENAGGFGLGLALAKRQVRAVGGTVSAANMSTGGLCVNVELPAA
ncbi:MAG: histidine kinase sensor domain-containing protein [Pseudomonadota bacterium]